MTAEYPNLELIEYKCKQFAFSEFEEIFENAYYPTFKVDVFMQTWATTATGFNMKNGISGQAFTNEYTTVIEMRWREFTDDRKKWRNCEDVIYGVFFGNELAYMFLNPKEQFFIDLKNRNMLAQREAIESYNSIDGNTE